MKRTLTVFASAVVLWLCSCMRTACVLPANGARSMQPIAVRPGR